MNELAYIVLEWGAHATIMSTGGTWYLVLGYVDQVGHATRQAWGYRGQWNAWLDVSRDCHWKLQRLLWSLGSEKSVGFNRCRYIYIPINNHHSISISGYWIRLLTLCTTKCFYICFMKLSFFSYWPKKLKSCHVRNIILWNHPRIINNLVHF